MGSNRASSYREGLVLRKKGGVREYVSAESEGRREGERENCGRERGEGRGERRSEKGREGERVRQSRLTGTQAPFFFFQICDKILDFS
jgi:hypothetical protein